MNQRKENDRGNDFMINLYESMGPGWDQHMDLQLQGPVHKYEIIHIDNPLKRTNPRRDVIWYDRGQIYFNNDFVLQDEWITIFTHPANTCTCPLKANAMKKVNKQCLLDTPRTVRVSEKTWQVIVRTRRP